MRNVLSKKSFSREKVHTGKTLALKIDLEKRDFIECHSFHARFVDTPQGNQNSCPIEVVQTARTKFPLAENGYPCAPKKRTQYNDWHDKKRSPSSRIGKACISSPHWQMRNVTVMKKGEKGRKRKTCGIGEFSDSPRVKSTGASQA